VADAGSILIGDPAEMFVLYRDESLSNLRATDLEVASDSELAMLAEAQKITLYTHHPLDKSVQQSELKRIIK
jgi:hypothetical protein